MGINKEDKKISISSDNLYHFTNDIDIIKSILQNGFYPRTSIENISFLLPEYDRAFLGTPMVCFCDIPIDLIEKHTNRYGKYGIGLSKKWGTENGITPVAYILAKKELSKCQYSKIEKIEDEDRTLMVNKLLRLQNTITDMAQQLDLIANMLKNEHFINYMYNKDIKKDITQLTIYGKFRENLKRVGFDFWSFFGYFRIYIDDNTEDLYYDEKEWRYIVEFENEYFDNRIIVNPEIVEKYINKYNSNIDKFIPKDYDSYSLEDKEQFDKKLKEEGNFKDLVSLIKEDKEIKKQVSDLNSEMENNPLKFTIKDIEEIILTDSDNVEEFISDLDTICDKEIDNNDKKSLREKIKILQRN